MDKRLDTAPCGFISFDDDGVVVDVNATLLQLLGHEKDGLSGLRFDRLLPVAGRIFYQTHFFPLLKLKGKVQEIYLTLLACDGREIPVLASAVRCERDGIVLNDCVFIPICQRILYEQELLEARNTAAQANAELEKARADLQAKQEQLLQMNGRLEVLATTDAVTGLKNRRVFEESLAAAIALAARHPAPFALMMIDVDRFKRINDTYGHQAGDRVLQRIAHILQENSREIDVVARYGGEEFGIILPNTLSAGAIEAAERMRSCIEAAPWGPIPTVTISIGVAAFEHGRDDGAAVLAAADQALYTSKKQGRNRVTYADEPMRNATQRAALAKFGG